MQRIKNIEEIILQLKPFLKGYLEDQGTIFRNRLFQCPNRLAHSGNDEKPSSGFVPNTDEQMWNCFACGNSSDIFGAYKFLEDKEINGVHWFIAVKELADRYGIECDLEPLLPEEIEFNNIQSFLQNLIKNANKYLLTKAPKKITSYLKDRLWETSIGVSQLGYLPNIQSVQKYVASSFKKYPELAKYLSLNIERPQDFTKQITDRLIYPIKHRYGYILGFVSRVIHEEDIGPKYSKHFLKNSGKGGVLFNLTKTYKTVYVVEGASSVFTLFHYNIKNVIATLGTAFTEQMYSSLIKHGINRVVFCFDGDEAGVQVLNKALELTRSKPDIKILVKELPLGKDPDDFIKENGIEAFNSILEVSNFKYYLIKFIEAKEENQEVFKEAIFDIIINTKDAILREKMLKLFVKETGVLKTILIEEIEKYEKKAGLIGDIGVGEILKEETALVKSIELFEERAWRSGKLKGVATGFSIFDEKIDGLQSGLILVAGKWNTGKSAWMQSVAMNLLNDPTNYVIYFSIDDPVVGTTIPRFIANLSRIPINTVSNPLYRIEKNETLTEAIKEDLKNKRNDGIKLLKTYSKRLGIKDATDGYDTNFIEKMIKIYKIATEGKKLIIFVDFLNMVTLPKKNIDRTELETQLAGFFKHMAGLYDIPVVCTVETTKGVTDTTMVESNIKGSSSLQFRSDLTLLLSSDFETSDKSEMYFYDDDGKAQPIVKIRVSKSKFSSFRKSIYFKFHRDYSRFEECSFEEQSEFRRKGC